MARITAEATAGASMGSMIKKKAFILEQPSSVADSNISAGISSINPRISQVTKGTEMAAWARMGEMKCPVHCKRLSMIYNGIMMVMEGTSFPSIMMLLSFTPNLLLNRRRP